MNNELELLYNNDKISNFVSQDGQVLFRSADIYKYLGVSRTTWNDNLRVWAEEGDTYVVKVAPDRKPNFRSPEYTANLGLKPGNNKPEYYLTEPGLYRACSIGKTEACKKFRDWVFCDVLPSIRKNGYYVSNYAAIAQLSNIEVKQRDALIDKILKAYFAAGSATLTGSRRHYKEAWEMLSEAVWEVERLRNAQHKEFNARARKLGYRNKKQGD